MSNPATASKYTRYVILLSAIPEKKPDMALLKRHVAFLRALDEKGQLVFSGPFTDYQGGMTIIKASDINEARKIATTDPLINEGIRNFELRTCEQSCEENNHLGLG